MIPYPKESGNREIQAGSAVCFPSSEQSEVVGSIIQMRFSVVFYGEVWVPQPRQTNTQRRDTFSDTVMKILPMGLSLDMRTKSVLE
jgi:hypothetical protein